MINISEIFYLYLRLLKICSIYTGLYFIFFFSLQFNKSFRKLGNNKKLYVVKNIIKTISLFYLSVISYGEVYNMIVAGDIKMHIARLWGSIYVGNDLTALLIVPNLPDNTRNHHIMTGLILNFVFMCDGDEVEIVKLIAIYTIFSYYSFLVNLFLGLRYLELDSHHGKLAELFEKAIDYLRIIAYYNYVSCLFVNWGFHIYYGLYLIDHLRVSHILYVLFLIPIVKDDLILLSWLKYKKNKT